MAEAVESWQRVTYKELSLSLFMRLVAASGLGTAAAMFGKKPAPAQILGHMSAFLGLLRNISEGFLSKTGLLMSK